MLRQRADHQPRILVVDLAALVAHVLREGLAVVASEAFAVDEAAAPHAVRVSLGAARNRTELGAALHLLAAALKTSTSAMQVV